MKKIFLIGWKDLTLAFRDKAALILMLAAPFVLTLGLGFVTGRFSGASTSGISGIQVILVNQDEGALGKALVNVFESPELDELLDPQRMDDPAQGRQVIDDDQAAALVWIPAGFTNSITSAEANPTPVQISVYTNPARPSGSGVVKTIVDAFANQAEVQRAAAQVTVAQLISTGRLAPQEAAAAAQDITARLAQDGGVSSAVRLKQVTSAGEAVTFDILAYLAPGMALMFLMYTVSNGGRSLLTERAQGTLPRLLVSPTSTAQVLAGKVLGIFLTGAAQMLILIAASTTLFQLRWGDPLAVLALVLAAVFGAVGWGLLITALARHPGQVAAVGSALMLLFGILGGSFVSIENMPVWFQAVSKITPNAWGLNGFTILSLGGGLADISGTIWPLLVMGAALFGLSALVFNRRGIVQA